jgi:hypothetical protein
MQVRRRQALGLLAFNQGLSSPRVRERRDQRRLHQPNRWPIAREDNMNRQYGSVVRQAEVLGGTSKSTAMQPCRKTAMPPRRKMVWVERPDFEG